MKKGPGDIFSKGFDELTREIESCFLEEPGPGTLPETRDNDDTISGILVPEDEYRLAGFSMAWAYKEIAETCFKDVYVIIGHTNGDSSLITRDIMTPLGTIRTDTEITSALANESGIATKDDTGEINDSIAVQLPFLQYASRDKLSQLRVVCIELGEVTEKQLKVLAHFLKKILREKSRKYCMVCSTNLTEFGERFGYKPFIYNIEESIENIDYHIIDAIQKRDWKDVLDFVKKEKANIPGHLGIALFMLLLDRYDSKLLQYYRSDYVDKDTENTVSFLSMEFL
ncbi:MAG: AmmeMemoRadiSam system protein B [Candidatus Woesearchaeota archaeon]